MMSITNNMNKNKNKIPSGVKKSVWDIYVGPTLNIGNCFCCKSQPITTTNFDCGHVQAKSKNGKNDLSNLRPICGSCNSSMGTQNMLEYMKTYKYKIDENTWNGINKEMADIIDHQNDDINDQNDDINNQTNESVKNKICNGNKTTKSILQCGNCNKIFKKKSNMDDHLNRKNKCNTYVATEQPNVLTELNKIVPNKELIREIVANNNNINNREIKGNVTNNITNNININIDNNIKKDIDNICDNNNDIKKDVDNICDNNNDINNDINNKIHICNHCNNTFARKNSLYKHIKLNCKVAKEELNKKQEELNKKQVIIDKLIVLENKNKQLEKDIININNFSVVFNSINFPLF